MPVLLKEKEVSVSRNRKRRVAAAAAEAPALVPPAAVKALVFPIITANTTDKVKRNMSSPNLTVTVVTTYLPNGKVTCQKYTGSASGLLTPIGIQNRRDPAAHHQPPRSQEAATATAAAAVTAATGEVTQVAPAAAAAATTTG